MKIKYLAEAYRDLESIEFYISQDNPEEGSKQVNRILDAVLRLQDFPYSGSTVPKAIMPLIEFRRIIVDNYIIFYRVIGEEIYIYRILHGKRDCNKVFNRLN